MRRLVASVCLLLIAAVIGGLPVYVRPQIDRLRHADAILILGGEGESRYLVSLDLGLKGWAPNLVVSNPPGAKGVWRRDFCAAPPPRLDLHCFVPDPLTTKGGGCFWLSRGSGRIRCGWRDVPGANLEGRRQLLANVIAPARDNAPVLSGVELVPV